MEEDSTKKASIIAKGDGILKTYPSIKEKVDLELNYINSLCESN